MAQITVRLDEQLAEDLKSRARAYGTSVNAFVVDVVRAAVDPEYESTDAERTRARLARAGLLLVPERRPEQPRPDEVALREARRVAGRRTPLSRLVSEGRD
jgi:plasmid stability protein